MSSWYESFPLPPIESMACGTATATTQYGTEDYAEDLSNALVVPPRRPELMADAIIRLLENRELALRLANAGVETALQLSWPAATDRLETVLGRALATWSPTRLASLTPISKGAIDPSAFDVISPGNAAT